MHYQIKFRIYLFMWMFIFGTAITAMPAHAQTRSTIGLHTAGNAVALAVPSARNLVSTIDDLENIRTQTQGCAKDGKVFDRATGNCRLAPQAVEVEFSGGATTQLRIQRPDGSFATYNLDGADGNAVVVP